MHRKLIAVGMLIALVCSGAFAQLVLGATGALHMDNELSGSEIRDRFEQGEGIFYGPFIEIIMGKLGLGLAANFSFYDADWSGTTYAMMDYDITGYVSCHLFGGHAFLDPFGELGGGFIATDFASDSDQENLNPYEDSPLMASYYWYAALGLGVNLGPIGLFGKFAFNYPIKKDVEGEWKGSGVSTPLYPYGYDPVLFEDGYLPKYRFTLGAKLIL